MDLSQRYVWWMQTSTTGTYAIDDIEPHGEVAMYELDSGASLADRWQGAKVTLEDGNPKKPALADSLLNTSRARVVSARLKDALIAASASEVEFLPVTLELDGKPLDVAYFLVHFLNRPECLDEAASGAVRDDIIDPDEIESIERLEFAHDPDRPLFRLPRYGEDLVMMRLDVAEALSKNAFSGVRLEPLYHHPDWQNDKKGTPLFERVRALYEHHHEKGKTIELTIPSAPARPRASAAQAAAWLALAPAHGSYLGDKLRCPYRRGDDGSWLDAYEDNPDDWPGFEPDRYRVFGFDGEGNHFLLDLDDDGAVVYRSHEIGYQPRRFMTLAKSMKEFALAVKP